MERFAKRKVKVMPARGGGKHIFFCEDSGTKHHVAQVSDCISEEAIYEKVKDWMKGVDI